MHCTMNRDPDVTPKMRKLVDKSVSEIDQSIPCDDADLTTMLSVDCLYHVFHWLPTVDKLNLGKVSRRWRDVISSRSWSDGEKLDFSLFDRKDWQTVATKRSRYTKILVVNFSKNESLLSRIIKKYFHQLEELNITLDRTPLSSKRAEEFHRNIANIFRKNKKLKAVRISAGEIDLINKLIKLISSESSELTFRFLPRAVLSVAPRDSLLYMDLSKFVNLERLELLHFQFIPDCLRGLHRLQHLKSLSIIGDSDFECGNPLNNISSHFPQLESVEIRFLATDLNMTSFVTSCPNLKTFICRNHCSYLRSSTLLTLSLYCPNLKELHLQKYFIPTIPQIPHFRNLELLTFTDPKPLLIPFSPGRDPINNFVEFIRHAPKLTKIVASYVIYRFYLPQIHCVLEERHSRIPLELYSPGESFFKSRKKIVVSNLLSVDLPEDLYNMHVYDLLRCKNEIDVIYG